MAISPSSSLAFPCAFRGAIVWGPERAARVERLHAYRLADLGRERRGAEVNPEAGAPDCDRTVLRQVHRGRQLVVLISLVALQVAQRSETRLLDGRIVPGVGCSDQVAMHGP